MPTFPLTARELVIEGTVHCGPVFTVTVAVSVALLSPRTQVMLYVVVVSGFTS